VLLAYFGDELAEPCGNCDLCDAPPELFDGTEAAQKALSAIYRTEERYGAEHVISVLRGETTEKIARAGHDRLAVFGLGAEHDKNWWRGVFRQIYALGLTWIDNERHGAWRLDDETARPVLRGERRVELRVDAVRARAAKGSKPAPAALLAEADEPLFTRLRALRRELAEAQGVPAYVVFPDRTLIDMATKKPATLDEMAGCHGVGGKKLQRYGAAFLAAITDAPEAREHPRRVELAAEGQGALFDALQAAQLELARGADGAGKPLTCSRATLAKIVEARPDTLAALERVPGMGPQKAARFGPAFLSILAEGAA
jgi:ATP-dependent DNA helicase RecQ